MPVLSQPFAYPVHGFFSTIFFVPLFFCSAVSSADRVAFEEIEREDYKKVESNKHSEYPQFSESTRSPELSLFLG